MKDISIHALHYRVRSRPDQTLTTSQAYFNPRTPLQSAILDTELLSVIALFQSTHSITECDARTPSQCDLRPHFNPRTPLQSAISFYFYGADDPIFQSTHSITECDLWHIQFPDHRRCKDFNPRTPLQSAIDLCKKPRRSEAYFNPRTPLQSAMYTGVDAVWIFCQFQSTHSITECDVS